MFNIKLIGALLLLTPMLANALGLGNARVLSKLNAPLNIELELLGANPLDLQMMSVNLASAQDFERAGLDRANYLGMVQCKVETQSGKSFVRITTKNIIAEPVVNLLIELISGQARVLKDYTILLDPPELAEQLQVSTPLPSQPLPSLSSSPSPSIQALQSRLAKLEQQLLVLSAQKDQQNQNAQNEQEKISLKEENDNLHHLVQRKEKEIELLKLKEEAMHQPALPVQSATQQKHAKLSHFEEPDYTKPASFSPWILFGLILTVLLSGLVGLKKFFIKQKIALPFDLKFSGLEMGFSKKQTAFDEAIMSIRAAEEEQVTVPKTADNQYQASQKKAQQEAIPKMELPTVEDADIYITFKKFAVAEEILLKILHHDPMHIQANAKLMDLLFIQDKRVELEAQFKLLPACFSTDYPSEYKKYQAYFNVNVNVNVNLNLNSADPIIAPIINPVINLPEDNQDPALFQTKLDFAKVYIEMQDIGAAKDLLNEVIQFGPALLKAEAQALLDKAG